VTTPHDDYATKSVLHSDKTIFTDAQQAEARVSAWLAGASGSFAREDIELLLNELGRRQTTIEAQERELHRVQSALLASEEQLSLAQEKAKSVSWGWSPETSPFKALIENIDGSIWSIDTNYRLTVSNSTYRQDVARAFGREIAAGDFLLAWDDYPEMMRVWKRCYDRALAGETFRIEAQRSSTDHKWMEYRFNPIRTSTGQIAGVTVFGSDVTERKHAEAMIQEQLAEITNYYDNAPVGLAVFDKELRYRRINHLLADANGFSVQEHLGKTVEEILPDLGEEMRRLTGQILATGEPVMGVEFSRASKREPRQARTWLANWHPIKRDGQEIIGFNVISQDITERKRAEESLRRSEHSLVEAQRLGHSGSWEYDLATQTATWSENMFRIFDVDPLEPDEAALKDDIEILIHPEDRDYVRMVREEALQGKRPYDLDYRIVRKDGTICILHSLAEIICDERGAPVRMVGRVQDVTERKQAEDRLRRSEHRLLEAQRIGSFGSWEVDLAANTLAWSENLFHIYDLEPGEPSSVELEHAFHSRLHPDDLEYVRTVYAEALQGKRPYDLEYRIVRKDGSIRAMHAQAQVERDAHGQAARVIGNVQDITERKQMIESLRRSEANIRALLDNTNDLISSRDPEGRLVLFNNSTAHFVQEVFRVEARPGLDMLAFLPEQERAHWKRIVANVYAGATHRMEFSADLPDGTHYYDTSLNPIWSEGQVIGLTDFTRDVTDRKREEEERERMRSQLVQAQKMETVGRLAGGIAHEFNNLLAVILMRTELSLPLVTQTDPLYRNLTTIQTITKRSAELVQQLLGFARKQMISPKVLDLNAVVDTALPMVRRLVGEEIRVVWRPGAPLCPIKMDQTQVEQVVVNLCLNARDAIDGFGVITIETHNAVPAAETNDAPTPSDSYVMLAVTDNGRGMDQETLEHIFEPFYTMNEFGTGAGLGLAMVDGVVQQNHGRIEVSSAPGQGATFKVFLPCHVDSTAAPAPNQSQPVPVGHGETVLLVEDEPDVLQIATDVLEYLKYKVIAVKAAAEAIDHIQNHAGKIDVLMTDVVMPAMNGAELANRIVALQPEIKCLFMSGYPTDAITHRGVLEGRSHFLQKPYTVRALAGKLREVLEKTP
jgi:PAS domain S-box-containing protein